MTVPALAVDGVSVSFGGVRACDDISLAVGPGEIVGLTGPNGSGKSTLLNAVVGLVPATGSVRVAGEPLRLSAPRAARRRGVVRTFQAPQNWGELSVLENAALGSPDRGATGLLASLARRRLVRDHERRRWLAAERALARVGLATLAGQPAAALTYGQQRLLELARAMVGEPAILLLDEPAAGLNAVETTFLGSLLVELGAEGVAVVVVDHKIDFLDAIASRIVVLQLGAVIAEGPPVDIWRQPGVIDAYLGRAEVEP